MTHQTSVSTQISMTQLTGEAPSPWRWNDSHDSLYKPREP